MKNTLINQKLLDEYISRNKLVDKEKIDKMVEWIKNVIDKKYSQERENYLVFFENILSSILGYSANDMSFEESPSDLSSSGRCEFLLHSNNYSEDNRSFKGLIELKGQKILLDKSQTSHKGFSPIDQAFHYAVKGKISYYIVSNYELIRIYNLFSQERFIECDVKNFLNDSSEPTKEFLIFLLLLGKKTFIVDGLLDEILKKNYIIEQEFTQLFYSLYHETRKMIHYEIHTNYSGKEKIEFIDLTQNIMNRIMFCLFAEDSGLLPPLVFESSIINPIKNKSVSPHANLIWIHLNTLFLDINSGNIPKGVNSFNGKLFEEDYLKLNIKIRDIVEDFSEFESIKDEQTKQFQTYFKNSLEKAFPKEIINAINAYKSSLNPIYQNLLLMASFDFKEELSVEILGHIFEMSLKDLNMLDQKRKKGGIYYTPEFVTDHIVKMSILRYLSNNELNIPHSIPELITSFEENIDALEDLIDNLKIIDPSCGSGAFLIKVVEFISNLYIAIFSYRRATEKKYVKKRRSKRMVSVENLDVYFRSPQLLKQTIIENNIYGVDILQTSVEITKLSLFLKIAQKDTSLPNLEQNIVTFDSLDIQWENSFPTVYRNNGEKLGFDIAIGNPPWGAELSHDKKFYEKKYTTGKTDYDSFSLFIEEILTNVVKNEGIFSFIIPTELAFIEKFADIRKFILEHSLLYELINLGENIFEDVTKPSMIFHLRKKEQLTKEQMDKNEIDVKYGFKKKEKNILKQNIIRLEDFTPETDNLIEIFNRNQKSFYENDNHVWDFHRTPEDRIILKKVNNDGTIKKFDNYVDNGRGIDINKKGTYILCPYCKSPNLPFGRGFASKYDKICVNCQKKIEKEDYEKEKETLTKTFLKTTKTIESDYPFLLGENIQRLFIKKPLNFIDYSPERYPFLEFRQHNENFLYNGERLLVRKVSKVLTITITDETLLALEQVYVFKKRENYDNYSHYYFLGILISKFIHFYHILEHGNLEKDAFPHFTQKNIKKLPIPEVNFTSEEERKNYQEIIKLTKNLVDLINNFNKINDTLHKTEEILLKYPYIEMSSLETILRKFYPDQVKFLVSKKEKIEFQNLIVIEGEEKTIIAFQTDEDQNNILEINGESSTKIGKLIEYLIKNQFDIKGISSLDEILKIPFPIYSQNKDKFHEILCEVINNVEFLTRKIEISYQEIVKYEGELNHIVYFFFKLQNEEEYINRRVQRLGYIPFGKLFYENDEEL